MRKFWAKLLLPFVVLSIAVAIAMIMLGSRSDIPRRPIEVAVPVVSVLDVEPGPVAITVSSQGTARARREIDLVSEVSGRVVWVSSELVEGSQVKQGTVLLRIDPIDYEVAVSEAKAAIAGAEFSLAEVKAVLKRAAIDEAEARLMASRDRLRQAEMDLANTAITAPFDAVIDSQGADLGQYISMGSAVMHLLGVEAAEIRLPILASDMPFLHYGQQPDGSWPEAQFTASFGELEYAWTGRLLRLEDRIDEQTRVFYLVAEVPTPYDVALHGRALPLGLFLAADIQALSIPNAVSVPRSALHGQDNVYLVENGSLVKRPVKVVRRDGDRVIVGNGLSEGEQVVLSRLDLMVAGMPVTVVDTQE
jgi:RND family efflux transporter MFP subunit